MFSGVRPVDYSRGEHLYGASLRGGAYLRGAPLHDILLPQPAYSKLGYKNTLD